LIYLAFAILIIGIFLLWFTRSKGRESGLPVGKIISSDTGGWKAVDSPLFDAEHQLTGRPDYLVETRSMIIPVEVKSSRVGNMPHEGHVLQLSAYCKLVESEYGVRPGYGIINYPGKTFQVDFTPKLERRLFQEIHDLRQSEKQSVVNRSHNWTGRCRACGYRSICDQNLSR